MKHTRGPWEVLRGKKIDSSLYLKVLQSKSAPHLHIKEVPMDYLQKLDGFRKQMQEMFLSLVKVDQDEELIEKFFNASERHQAVLSEMAKEEKL